MSSAGAARVALAVALTVLAPLLAAEPGRVIQVGPGRAVATLAAAALLVRDGDTVEVDAGDYRGDVAVWSQERLTIRAVGGRARLIAAGRSAEDKAIWVVRSGSLRVENLDFSGARVADRNGAGIRFERGRLVVRNCRFIDNENGILSGSDSGAELDIEDSEFADNGAGDGQSHNLYVGRIRRLRLSGSHLHHARVGHLLKSRAAENLIAYNRLADGSDGRASYELEFPNGGVAHVIGNVVQQGPRTANRTIVAFGAEGYAWERNELYLAHNTVVDERRPPGRVLAVWPGRRRVVAVNNLVLGGASLEDYAAGEFRGNLRAGSDDFVDVGQFDFRLRPGSALRGRAVDPGVGGGVSLRPAREYVDPRRTAALDAAAVLHPGALQRLGPAM